MRLGRAPSSESDAGKENNIALHSGRDDLVLMGSTVAVTNESDTTDNNYCRDRRAGNVARFLHFRRTRRLGLIHFSVGFMCQATI